jgi:hypothetical protein
VFIVVPLATCLEIRLAQSAGGYVGNVCGAHLATALHQRLHGVLLRLRFAAMNVLLLAADECLVAFDNLALATDRASRWVGRSLAQTHGHEPSGFVADAQHALYLLR